MAFTDVVAHPTQELTEMTFFLPHTENQPPWSQAWEPAPGAPPLFTAGTGEPPRPASGCVLGAPPSPVSGGPASLSDWLDDKERELTHPRVVEKELVRAGWHPNHASVEALRYRSRFNEHRLGYSALLVATGIAALSLGTSGHLLAAGIDHQVNRDGLAGWLTLFVVSLPFVVWAHIWAAQLDRHDPVAFGRNRAVRSPSRWYGPAASWASAGCSGTSPSSSGR